MRVRRFRVIVVSLSFLLLGLLFLTSTGTSLAASHQQSAHTRFVFKPSPNVSYQQRVMVTPLDEIVPCLQVGIALSNPQTNQMSISTWVTNKCTVAVTDIWLSFDVEIRCNGNSQAGPSDTNRATYLAVNQTVDWLNRYAAVCYGTQFPYFPVAYSAQGFAEAGATYSLSADAVGDYTSPWYNNFV